MAHGGEDTDTSAQITVQMKTRDMDWSEVYLLFKWQLDASSVLPSVLPVASCLPYNSSLSLMAVGL